MVQVEGPQKIQSATVYEMCTDETNQAVKAIRRRPTFIVDDRIIGSGKVDGVYSTVGAEEVIWSTWGATPPDATWGP
jgi:hypothetical protein